MFNQNVRDPWIAEGVGHALLAIRNRIDTDCLDGPVVAVMIPHVKPSVQGLDLFAIYDDAGLPAVALGEAKATLQNGSGRLTESISFFSTVEAGDRDVDIKMCVVALAEGLPQQLVDEIGAGFWHERGTFLPLIAHGDEVDMANTRPAFAALKRDVAHKRVLFCRPQDYSKFFDCVADAMREAVREFGT